MLTEERCLAILAFLKKKQSMEVLQLSKLLGASESNIRRDLTALHNMGKLNKVHGGTTALENNQHGHYTDILEVDRT